MLGVRRFSSTAVAQVRTILPAVKVKAGNRSKSERFSKNFPADIRIKAWEKTGEDKETFFKRKYAHVHAKEKKSREEKGLDVRRGRGSERKREGRGLANGEDKQVNDTNKKNSSNSRKEGDGRKLGKTRRELEAARDDNPFRQDSRDDKKDSFKRKRFDNSYDSFRGPSSDYAYKKRDAYSGIRPSPLSEYIYGSSPVLAALTAKKRVKFNKLIIFNPKYEDQEIIELAKQQKINIVKAKDKNEMNILSNNGVHNGFILDSKPMVPQLIHHLGPVDRESGEYQVEEDFLGDSVTRKNKTSNPFPLGIVLDEVSDPHNVGAIIRSAHFLGADFIVMSSRNCAPLSPVVAKTSVGALEFIPIYSCTQPLQFLEKSKNYNWKVVTTGAASHPNDAKINNTLKEKYIHYNELDQLIHKSPVLLVLGSEGEGIRTTLKLRSDHIVSVESGPNCNPVIDSLNVSVASALLIQKILDYYV